MSLLMSTLILLVSFIVHQFSRRYMAGDRRYRLYFLKLAALTCSAIVMAYADNLVLFWMAWTCSNCLLVSLMIHKSEWAAAKHAGILALKTLGLGSAALFASFLLLYQATGSSSITAINAQATQLPWPFLTGILVLLLVSALTQSAQWPFHRWLTSSLNSPTPISALMHAGLVNGGGFILVRFAPLFLTEGHLLQVVFLIGALTAILGSVWKLLQSDIKRMLANSTLAQMGFMMMQCGLGLFPAAVAHLCWHGLFKAYLFLNAGSALNTSREKMKASHHSLLRFALSCLMGLAGALSFALTSGKPLLTLQPTTFLVGFAFISGTQLAYTLVRQGALVKRIIPAFLIVSFVGLFYGESIHLIESFFPTYSTQGLPTLNLIHLVVFTLFIILWLGMNLKDSRALQQTKLWRQLYVRALNGSQPHPKTITAHRNNYHY
ncbi:proton-conducting transporter membrane subunit [Legionella busanensis]|uniref:proton-conducting transporter transmembrane domain-containing protein n=1 Tax=Legionella busanensis TaxID=190655 RepID=UPI0011C077CF